MVHQQGAVGQQQVVGRCIPQHQPGPCLLRQFRPGVIEGTPPAGQQQRMPADTRSTRGAQHFQGSWGVKPAPAMPIQQHFPGMWPVCSEA